MQPRQGKFNCQATCTTKESDKRAAVHTLSSNDRLVSSTGQEMLKLALEIQRELQKSLH